MKDKLGSTTLFLRNQKQTHISRNGRNGLSIIFGESEAGKCRAFARKTRERKRLAGEKTSQEKKE